MASQHGHTEIVQLLLADSRIVPSDYHNYPIRLASKYGHIKVVKLLWKNKKIKDSLKYDDIELYNSLIQEDLQKKIKDFL